MGAYCGDDAQGRFLDYFGYGASVGYHKYYPYFEEGAKETKYVVRVGFASDFFVRTSFSHRDLALEEATTLSLITRWGIGTLPSS